MKKKYQTPQATCHQLTCGLIALSSTPDDYPLISDGGEGENQSDGYADANAKAQNIWEGDW